MTSYNELVLYCEAQQRRHGVFVKVPKVRQRPIGANSPPEQATATQQLHQQLHQSGDCARRCDGRNVVISSEVPQRPCWTFAFVAPSAKASSSTRTSLWESLSCSYRTS
jgi:hypothetical protein